MWWDREVGDTPHDGESLRIFVVVAVPVRGKGLFSLKSATHGVRVGVVVVDSYTIFSSKGPGPTLKDLVFETRVVRHVLGRTTRGPVTASLLVTVCRDSRLVDVPGSRVDTPT